MRRRTMNSTEFPKLKLTMSLGEFCGPNNDSLSLCQGIHEPVLEYRFRFTSVGTFPLAHHCDKRGATLMPNPRPWDANRVSGTLRVEGRCVHTNPVLPGTSAVVAFREVNLQPASVHRRPAENLPQSPPLRQRANLRPDRKPHL